MKNQEQTVRQLLQDFDTAMLVTHASGQFRARPMALARVDEDCGVWFLTARETAKVHEIESRPEVLVTCQNDHSRYVALSGNAELVLDTVKSKELWKESYKAWFPGGPADPDPVLVHVRPVWAEYWDSSGLKGARYLFKVAKAYVSGHKPEAEEGDQHGNVRLKTASAGGR